MMPNTTKRDTCWLHETAYRDAEEERRKGFPLGDDPLDAATVLPYDSTMEKSDYIDAIFWSHNDYVESQVQWLYQHQERLEEQVRCILASFKRCQER